ncbi:MAG: hypothetical protein JRN50_02230 [Nitrososphaerota archaeon]|nr:hypothetical protein [Nitrososphaerota archaeon]
MTQKFMVVVTQRVNREDSMYHMCPNVVKTYKRVVPTGTLTRLADENFI